MSYLRRADGEERVDNEERVLQLQYERDSNWKLRTKALFVSFIIVIVMTPVVVLATGAKSSPFYLPIAPMLFTVTIGFCIIIFISMAFRVRDLGLLEKMGQREYKLGSIKISQKGAIVHIAAAAIFVGLFVTVLPFVQPNWLQDMMVAGENYDVLSGRPHDLRFQGNDAFDATALQLDAESTNDMNVTFFLGEYNRLKDVDSFNLTGAKDVTVDGGYKENGTSFSFDGKELRRDGYYILRIYNGDETNNASIKVQVKRVIKPDLTYGMFSVALLYLFQGIGWFAFLTMMKRPSPEEAQGPPMARDRYGRPVQAPYPQVQQDSRGLPPEAYYERGGGRGPPAPGPGPYGARGAAAGAGAGYGRGPPQHPSPRDDGYGYNGEQGMGPPPVAQARGRPAGGMGRPGPGQAAVALPPAGPPRSKIASIKCPRCKLQFTYERTGGPQTIKCPNCGKEGRIGGKKGAPGAAPARPPAAARPQAPAQAAPTGRRPPVAAAAAGGRRKKNIRCPQCKQMFDIVERPRPFDIECPHCGKKGRLK